MRSVGTRRALSCSSASCPSSVWFVKSRRTSRCVDFVVNGLLHLLTSSLYRRTCASNPLPSWLSRRPPRHTSSRSSRTPTLPPSTPSVSPSSRRISLLLVVSVASAHNGSCLFSVPCILLRTIISTYLYFIYVLLLVGILFYGSMALLSHNSCLNKRKALLSPEV